MEKESGKPSHLKPRRPSAKTSSFSDVDIHLVGFGGEYQKYPSHYTVGGKLTFKGKTPNLQFSEPPKDKPIVTGCPKTDSFLQWLRGWEHDINLAIGKYKIQTSLLSLS